MDGKHPKKYARYTPCDFGITKTGRIQYPFVWKGTPYIEQGLNGYGGVIPQPGDYCYWNPSAFLSPHNVGRVLGIETMPVCSNGAFCDTILTVETMIGSTHAASHTHVYKLGEFPWRVAKLTEAEYGELKTLLAAQLAKAVPVDEACARQLAARNARRG